MDEDEKMKKNWTRFSKTLISCSLLIMASGLGWTAHWFFVNVSLRPHDAITHNVLRQIFSDANTLISQSNNHCDAVLTVSDALSLMVTAELRSKISQMSLNCAPDVGENTNRCRLNYSDCRPWQSSECGSRFLTFDLDNDEKIVRGSYSCIDVP